MRITGFERMFFYFEKEVRIEKEDSGDTAHRFKYRSSRVLGNVGQGKHQLQKRGGP